MLCSYIYAIPTPNTLQLLNNVFDGAPFEIHWDQLQVAIFTSSEHLDESIVQSLEFEAKPVKLDLWMNLLLGGSSLILALESPQLSTRNAQYNEKFTAAFTEYYYPHVTILQQFPALKRSYVGFVSNSSSILVESEPVLTFTGEYMIHTDMRVPPDAGFLEAMYMDGY